MSMISVNVRVLPGDKVSQKLYITFIHTIWKMRSTRDSQGDKNFIQKHPEHYENNIHIHQHIPN